MITNLTLTQTLTIPTLLTPILTLILAAKIHNTWAYIVLWIICSLTYTLTVTLAVLLKAAPATTGAPAAPAPTNDIAVHSCRPQ